MFVLSIGGVVVPYQAPKLRRVIGVDQMAQFMNDYVICNYVRCLDDVPVKDDLPIFVARTPARPEMADADSCW